MKPQENERGSGTVLALGIIAILLILLVTVAGLIGLISAQQKATQAADLAALAAADAARGLTTGEPCILAKEVAEANHAQLANCNQPQNLAGTVDIRTRADIAGPFGFLGRAESVSRAGPPNS